MAMSMRLNMTDLARGLDRLRTRVPNAAIRASNRAAVSARQIMTSTIASDLGIKSSAVKDAMRIDEASTSRPTARLIAEGVPIELIHFGAKGPEPSRGRGRGVTARLQPPGRGLYPHAFIATMRSGHRGVFERDGRTRLPIHELHGPSIAHVFARHRDVGLERGRESLITNLKSEMAYALGL